MFHYATSVKLPESELLPEAADLVGDQSKVEVALVFIHGGLERMEPYIFKVPELCRLTNDPQREFITWDRPMPNVQTLDLIPQLTFDHPLLQAIQIRYGCMVCDYHLVVCLYFPVDGLSLRLGLCSLITCGSLLCLHLLWLLLLVLLP